MPMPFAPFEAAEMPRYALVAEDHLPRLRAAFARRNDPRYAAAAGEINAMARQRPKLFHEQDGIAVIPVYGMLVNGLDCLDPVWGMTGYEGIRVKAEAAAADPEIRAIVLDISSGGGMVSGCSDTAETIFRARDAKPVAAILNEEAYSAAYWLAAAAHSIAVPLTGGVGSIGVLSIHVEVSKALEKAGYTVSVLRAGKRKADWNWLEPLSSATRTDAEKEIAAIRDLFVGAVARYRGLDAAAVYATEARTVPAITGEALDLRLADAVASPADAWRALVDHLAGARPAAP